MVHDDEPCHGLREEARKGRWIQTVFVVRGDTLAAHTTDYGPAENFSRVTPLMMPSFGDDTVAQLREHADRNRHDTYWHERGEAHKAESTLIRDHIDRIEQVKTFVQRNPRTVKEITR